LLANVRQIMGSENEGRIIALGAFCDPQKWLEKLNCLL